MDCLPFLKTVAAAYGLSVTRAERTPGGWSAEAYVLDTPEGRFFLKIYDKRRASVRPWIERMDGYLPVMIRLADSQLGPHMPRLRRSVDGHLKIETAEAVFLMFDYLDGCVPGETPLTQGQIEELAAILAGLHNSPADDYLENQSLAEDLTLPFHTALEAVFLRAADPPAALRTILSPHTAELSAALKLTVRLNSFRREARPETVLCHTDAHNWNLIQCDQLILLDWEGLRLAPAESDLFMVADSPYFQAFMKVYESLRPDFALSGELLYYYRFRRRMEDVFEFITQLLYDNPGLEATREALMHLKNECEGTAKLLEEYERAGLSAE